MSATGVAPMCTCQTTMSTAPNGIHFCPNCDVPQDQERVLVDGKPKGRITTKADRQFHLIWEQRKRAIYGLL